MKLPISRKKLIGQSLIETMITVVVISISVVSLIRFQNYIAYDGDLAKQKGQATILANKQLETLLDFHVLTTMQGYVSYDSIASGTSSSTVNGTNYTVSWTVTPFELPTYKNVNINVSWTDRHGSNQSVAVSSDIAGIEPAFSAMAY